MKYELPDSEIIEVVLKKEMTILAYKKIIEKSKKQGWNIQAYEIGYSSMPSTKKVEEL